LTAQLHSPEVPVDADIRLRAHAPADRCRVATAHRINYVHRPRRSRTTISFSDQVNARADSRLPPEQKSPTPIWGPCLCSRAAAPSRLLELDRPALSCSSRLGLRVSARERGQRAGDDMPGLPSTQGWEIVEAPVYSRWAEISDGDDAGGAGRGGSRRVAPASFAGCDDPGSSYAVVQRRCSRALEAVVVPAALDAVTLQLTLRRLRALPTASLGLLAPFFAVPFTRHV